MPAYPNTQDRDTQGPGAQRPATQVPGPPDTSPEQAGKKARCWC